MQQQNLRCTPGTDYLYLLRSALLSSAQHLSCVSVLSYSARRAVPGRISSRADYDSENQLVTLTT